MGKGEPVPIAGLASTAERAASAHTGRAVLSVWWQPSRSQPCSCLRERVSCSSPPAEIEQG